MELRTEEKKEEMLHRKEELGLKKMKLELEKKK